MKNSIIKLFCLIFVSLICFSCSSSDKEREYEDLSELDFGKGVYRPNPFAVLDSIPPFSWMGSPTPVRKETEFEIQFNEDAIRSESVGRLAFFDMKGNKVDGITFGFPASKTSAVKASSQKIVIPISYDVTPNIGDSILTGHIVIIGENLDQVNDVKLTSGVTPIASWKLTHEIGINWLRWIILIIIVAVILFLLGWLIYWLCIWLSRIAGLLSLISIAHTKISSKKVNNKKKKKKLLKYLKIRQDILLNSSKTLTEKATALEEMFQFFNFELSQQIREEQFGLMDIKIQNAFTELWKPQGYLFAPISNGKWTGQPKNSKWIPDDDYTPPNRSYSNLDNLNWAQIKEKYNFKGLVFSQGKPDFRKVAYKTVEIDDFGNYMDINKLGKRTNLHEAAFAELAKQMNISIYEAHKYKEKERLMWHEDSNCRTLYLVPYEIHGNINHFGGIGMYSCLINNKLLR